MRKVLMPQVGKSPGSHTLAMWMKSVGQAVNKGETLARVESLEGMAELALAEGGTLSAILVPAGKSVAAGTPICEISESAGKVVETKSSGVNMSASKPTGGKVVPIVMPQAGNSMEEGTVVKWRVSVGEQIAVGQIMFEVETDKATMEVEATEAGRLAKIVANEGDVVPVKQPVAYLADNDADVEAMLGGAAAPAVQQQQERPAAVEQQVVTQAQASVAAGGAIATPTGDLKVSPAARRIAREQNLDLGSVGVGSGPGGRILSTDLGRAGSAAAQPAVPASVSRPAAAATPAPASKPAASVPPVAAPGVKDAKGSIRRKMSKMRKAIAANLSLSKQTVPHFYLRCTINAEAMMAFYRAQKANFPCSVNDVVTMACAKAIMEFPGFRSKIDGDEIVEFPQANIGVAVGVDDGLTVPVLIGANAMSLAQIGANTKRIVESARAGKLEGFGEGNFTITNLGMFGVEEFAAIVNPPEPGILAVGAVREDVIVKDGMMKPGKVMTMTLSCDHRVVDGLLAAKFMARLKELLENPTLLA